MCWVNGETRPDLDPMVWGDYMGKLVDQFTIKGHEVNMWRRNTNVYIFIYSDSKSSSGLNVSNVNVTQRKDRWTLLSILKKYKRVRRKWTSVTVFFKTHISTHSLQLKKCIDIFYWQKLDII